MEANSFVTNLKAEGSENDIHDLDEVFTSYKELLAKIPSKNIGTFSLNVLCILSRNIDKVPSWYEKIDGKALLNLAIDCVRQTRGLDRPERIKVLACVYHIHKFIVRKPSQPPPELVLKLSYMPFEYDQDNLLTEYCKTYWNLLADRLMFIEQFKSGRRSIVKLLPKVKEDVQKVISMYDTVQFCSTILVFLLKKLHFLYSNEHAKDLNEVFGAIFESLALKKDVKAFKKLSEKELLDLYGKLNDCFYVIAENATRIRFKESVLTAAVRKCIPFIGHAPELFHCLQTFYLNSFCCLLTDNDNSAFSETVLNSLIMSCETAEKLGYAKAMKVTYSYINQLLRVYVEFSLTKTNMTEDCQETCLKLIILLLDKLKNTEQLLKCDGCNIKSGLHDALRLSFLAKNFITHCVNSKLDVTVILPPYLMIIQKQHSILTELCRLGCSNHEKCLRKLQTDIHNTAILLNKASYFDSAIQLFDLYLTHEFLHFKTSQDLKNISRAFYNKSICELDSKMYEKALIDGFLSLVFAQPDGLGTEKYMGLVMDVKAKALKGGDDEELQMMTVLDACEIVVDRELYGNLKPFFRNLEFGPLLEHEFNMYARLWPSLSPVAGVWRALRRLAARRRHAWMCAQPPAIDALCSVILQTPLCVRTIHNPHLSAILSSLLDDKSVQSAAMFETLDMTSGDVKTRVTVATMLFLKAELDMADAAVKYEWKIKDQSVDPDLAPSSRTLAQEHAALAPARAAVEMWTEVLPRVDDVPQDFLKAPLLMLRVMLQQLLHARRALALPLAHVLLRVSQRLGDRTAYLEAAGIILSHAHKPSDQLRRIMTLAADWAGRMLEEKTMEPALVFLCDAAIFYNNTKQPAISAKLIRLVQAQLLTLDVESVPLAAGRLLDATADGADLSAGLTAQRHYLTVPNTETNWCLRHHRSLYLKHRIASSTLACTELSRALRLRRRARAATACALGAAAAAGRARLCALASDPHRAEARTTIDQPLKHIVGLQTNECALQKPPEYVDTKATALFTPQPKVDIMRDAQIPKRHQTSPTIPVEYVAAYKTPEFYDHDNKCECYACENPSTLILASFILGLEATVFFRTKEFDVARNYFDGVLSDFSSVETKLKASVKKLRANYEKYIVDIIEKIFEKELLDVELEVLIEAAYFELLQKNYAKSDDYIYVRIHEILQATDVDGYTKTEIMNLMIASEVLRKADKIPDRVADLENDLEYLKLTPTKEILKTPEKNPTKPPVFNKVVVDKEELPDLKCKIPVLNFDEPEEQTAPKKKTNFKIPIPTTNKPVLETITPRPRCKVRIVVTEPSAEEIDVVMTPQTDKSNVEFFSPSDSTPDQFFTPQTSVKTYAKKSLRQTIIKNLEQEFSSNENTNQSKEDAKEKEFKENSKPNENSKPKESSKPKGSLPMRLKSEVAKTIDPEASKKNSKPKTNSESKSVLDKRAKVETGSLRTLKDNRLKRSTSPGKLPKEEKPKARPRRPAVRVEK